MLDEVCAMAETEMRQSVCERLLAGVERPLETAVLFVTVGRTELLRKGCNGGLLAADDAAAEVSRRGDAREFRLVGLPVLRGEGAVARVDVMDVAFPPLACCCFEVPEAAAAAKEGVQGGLRFGSCCCC